MRRTRIFTIVLFVIAAAAFAVSQVMQMMTDKSGPAISMDTDSITVSAEASEKDLLQWVTAQDNTDGDVSQNLMIENMSNLMEGDTRIMTIVAFDSDGNVSKAQRSVTYNDYHAPQFTLDGRCSMRSVRMMFWTTSARPISWTAICLPVSKSQISTAFRTIPRASIRWSLP